MKTYKIGQKVKVAGIKAKVALVGTQGYAYLVPLDLGVVYNNYPTLLGVVFAVLDTKGKDSLGNKAVIYKCK